jgi:hypothetical protein
MNAFRLTLILYLYTIPSSCAQMATQSPLLSCQSPRPATAEEIHRLLLLTINPAPAAEQKESKDISTAATKRYNTRAHPYAASKTAGFVSALRKKSNEKPLNSIKYHKKPTPVQCTECGKKISRPEHMVYHMRMHTGERPEVCHWCDDDTRFSDPRNLTAHIRAVHNHQPRKQSRKRFD